MEEGCKTGRGVQTAESAETAAFLGYLWLVCFCDSISTGQEEINFELDFAQPHICLLPAITGGENPGYTFPFQRENGLKNKSVTFVR